MKFKEFLKESLNITIDANQHTTEEVVNCIESRFKDVVERCTIKDEKIHIYLNSLVDRKKARKILDHLEETL